MSSVVVRGRAPRPYNGGVQLIRRNDHEARIEILPLIDVVFLLLTFFIFSMLVMVHLEMLEIDMVPLATGKRVEPDRIRALTVNIDSQGALHLDGNPLSLDGLMAELQDHEASGDPPTLFLALSRRAEVDRAPLMLDLINRFLQAGFRKYTFVGPPSAPAE